MVLVSKKMGKLYEILNNLGCLDFVFHRSVVALIAAANWSALCNKNKVVKRMLWKYLVFYAAQPLVEKFQQLLSRTWNSFARKFSMSTKPSTMIPNLRMTLNPKLYCWVMLLISLGQETVVEEGCSSEVEISTQASGNAASGMNNLMSRSNRCCEEANQTIEQSFTIKLWMKGVASTWKGWKRTENMLDRYTIVHTIWEQRP